MFPTRLMLIFRSAIRNIDIENAIDPPSQGSSQFRLIFSIAGINVSDGHVLLRSDIERNHLAAGSDSQAHKYVEPLQSSNRRNDLRYITPGISPCARGSRTCDSRRYPLANARTHAHAFAHAIANIRLTGNTAGSINRPRPGAANRTGCTPSVYRSCEIEGKEDQPVQLGCLRA